ncbi:hypothetical protein D2V93_04310, partial [Flagellimonas taeanensis]|uniref:hypothetical protein n=1 Tax=Flagellimonas taeanensis TaxID=1005926 RepID=UPI000EC9211C
LKNLLPVMLLALLMACEKQEATYPEPNQETDDRNVRLESLTIDELPQLVGAIEKRGSKMGWASKSEGGDIVLDGSRVLAVTDSVGNRTYSLRMYVPGTPHNVFYNVVGKQTHDGVQNEPFVLRYEVDEDYWPEYAAGPRQEKPFRGKIGLYNLETFGLQNMQEGRTGGTPEPCYEAIADGNGNGGSGGNNSGGSSNGGTDHDPGSDYQYWNTYAPDNGGGSGGREPFVEVGEGRFGDFGTDGTWKRALTGKSADCPEEETLLPINEEDFEEKIDDAALKPCLKNILNDLKTLNKGVGHIVQKFAGNIPGFNWEVKDGRLSGATGSTDPPAHYNHSTGTITTTFDSQAWKQATDLSWARTMLHEGVHAYLAAEFAISRPNWIATYPQMVAEWGRLKNWNAVHHEEIARSIVNDIAVSLEEYGIRKGYKLSRQFYEDMAWGGLQSTSTFNSLSSFTKNRISNVISVELTGKNLTNTPRPQKGTKAGC